METPRDYGVVAGMIALLFLLAAEPAATPAAPPAINPRAIELVDADPVLKAWALARFDSNHDGWLTLFEAQPAIAAFRSIADSDGDQRITVREFKDAVGFLQSRYNLR